MIDSLLSALRAALDEEVTFYDSVPNKFFANSVIVAPADPFIQPTTMGLVTESWQVLVVMSKGLPDKGVARLRDISLRIRSAVSSVGAQWQGTSGPRTVSDDNVEHVLMVNDVMFKYDPAALLVEESSSSSSSSS